jgi:hypothetical protein
MIVAVSGRGGGYRATTTSMPWLSSWSGARISTTWRSPTRRSTRNFVNYYRPEAGRSRRRIGPRAASRRFTARRCRVSRCHRRDQRAARRARSGRDPQDIPRDAPGWTLGSAADRKSGRARVHRHLPGLRRPADRTLDVDGHRPAPAADAPPDGERVTVTLSDSRTVVPASSRACPTHGVSSQSSTAE